MSHIFRGYGLNGARGVVYDHGSVACRQAEKPLMLASSLLGIIRNEYINISYRINE